MSLLEDGVFSSTSYRGLGLFRFDSISYAQKKLLKSIKPRQRRKFKNNGLVPWQLLHVLWDMDFLPTKNRPQEGMRIPDLLKLLREGRYRDDKQRARGILLHDKIDEEECLSNQVVNEIFIKGGQGKFVPVSFLREIPGTIFK